MSLVCEHCKNTFNNISALNVHQKNTKYCLIIQGKIQPDINKVIIFDCKYCQKVLTSKQILNAHELICDVKIKQDNINKENEMLKLRYENTQLLEYKEQIKEILNFKDQEIIKFQKEINKLKEELKEAQEDILKYLQNENKDKQKKIEDMTKKYLKRQPRVQYEVPNVIYIVTTALLKKERRYILGKAGDLTFRLSTYNKTDEHEVIYYQGCGDGDTMTLVETVVFQRLKEYRERANRERFLLPEDKEVDIFIDAIKKSIEFVIEK